MEQTIWKQEQQHLIEINTKLKLYINFLETQLKRQKGDIVEERIFASSEFNDVSGENAIQFSQVLQTMELREMEYIRSAELLSKARILYKTPYFGRISIKNEGGEEETLYIGLSTFRDPQNDDVYIFDWRAPISSLFYENQLGPTTFSIPSGEKVEVDILGRRQYKTHYDKLLQVLDAEIYIGDEVLQSLLNDTAKEKMKSIVATIQADQNAVIRSSNRNNLIVLGPPGSGKTSVAMQRIAYLLYEYREQLNAQNILLISPSDLFNDYISNVLPELGEENVKHTTFYRIWHEAKVNNYDVETNYENIERMQTASQIEQQSYQFKNSASYAAQLEQYVGHLKIEGMAFYNLKIGENLLFSAKQLRTYFYEKYSGLDIDFRLKKMRMLLLHELQKRKIALYEETLKLLRNVNRYIGSDKELEIEANNIVNKKFGKMQALIEQLKFINVHKMYIQSLTFSNQTQLANNVASFTAEKLKLKQLHYEDIAPLLYLENVLKKIKVKPEIKHIVIDEVQDYSKVQLQAIQIMHPNAHYTLLGDKNQIVHPTKEEPFEVQSLSQFQLIELTKSYRSTKEITDFTSAILNNTTTLSLGVKGEKPVIIETTDVIHSIVELIKQHNEDESMAIIAKNRAMCEALYNELKPFEESIQHITERDKTYMKGILIMPGYMAKGFEFTTVVLADASNYNEKTDNTLLYTIASRATRQLYLVKEQFKELPIYFKHISLELYEN